MITGFPTCGLSDTYLAQCRMSLIASMLVSGKAALHTNSDRHFTASWNESIAAAKCAWKVFTEVRAMKKRRERVQRQLSYYTLKRSQGSRSQSKTWQIDMFPSMTTLSHPGPGILTDNMPSGLEGQLHDSLIVVGGCLVEYGENVLPTWTDVCCLRVYHLSNTSYHHVFDSGGPVILCTT